MEKRFLNIDEASEISGLSASTIRREIARQGGLPSIKVRERVLLDREVLISYLKHHVRRPSRHLPSSGAA